MGELLHLGTGWWIVVVLLGQLFYLRNVSCCFPKVVFRQLEDSLSDSWDVWHSAKLEVWCAAVRIEDLPQSAHLERFH